MVVARRLERCPGASIPIAVLARGIAAMIVAALLAGGCGGHTARDFGGSATGEPTGPGGGSGGHGDVTAVAGDAGERVRPGAAGGSGLSGMGGEPDSGVDLCGNGTLDTAAGENCDDGNRNSGDGCDEHCCAEIGFNCPWPPIPPCGCGNGIIEGSETCDDGNWTTGDGCSDQCQPEPLGTCSNGAIDEYEQCDDGNVIDGDGCDHICRFEYCGQACGDGVLSIGEACDDGNTVSADGCAEDCAFVEPGYDCPVPVEPCVWTGPPGCEGVIAFEDPALDAAVREAIGMSEGDIRYEDVADLSELSWSDLADQPHPTISDLSGIQCLKGLTVLTLYNNEITDVSPLAELPALTELYIASNDIGDVSPLSALSSLEALYVSWNDISDISSLSGLTSLRWVHFDGNSISDLTPISQWTSLVYLGLPDNQVSDLTPLAVNLGLGSGDPVHVQGNPIDCAEQADNIQTLRDRGVDLDIDCP